jgi:serpin B
MRTIITWCAVATLALALGVTGCEGNGDDGLDVPATDTANDPGGTDDLGEPTDPGPTEDPGTPEDPGPATDPGGETMTQAQRYLESDEFAEDVDPSLPAANTAFAVDLFRTIHESEAASKNLFISPLSVSTALAMVYQGATGETRTAIADTLGFAGIDPTVLDTAWHDLIRSLRNVDDDVLLAIANSVWMDLAFAPAVQQSFLDAVVAIFGSELHTLDFQGADALDTINGWVEDHTNGRIQDLIDQIPPSVVMYLINAIYFKADWLYPFDPEDTFVTDFTRADGTKTTVDMMGFPKRVTSFAYGADDDFCVVRLPYGRDQVAFYGFVPWGWEDLEPIETFIDGLTAEKLEGYIRDVAMPQYEGDGLTVRLPKFKIEYKTLLNDALIALGMGPAFDLGGFDGIAEGLGISRVIHQTFVEVDEKGTEAAAATAVEVFSGITPDFIGDKPFFFVIRDDRTGTILFMGKVADPTAG